MAKSFPFLILGRWYETTHIPFGKTESLIPVFPASGKNRATELENLEINDGDVKCGHISREVTFCTDGGGTVQPTVKHWELQ